LGETHRVVDSSVELQVGSTVHATITRLGDRLELKYLGADIVEAFATPPDAAAASLQPLSALEARYAVLLGKDQRDMIETAMRSVAEPQAMAAGGIYLSKLSQPLD